jgi:Ca2+-binding RTX toxin-like protein
MLNRMFTYISSKPARRIRSVAVVTSGALFAGLMVTIGAGPSVAQAVDPAVLCGMCLTEPSVLAVSVTGSSKVTVNGGGVYANSNAAPAVSVTGSSKIVTNAQVRAAGTIVKTGSSTISGTPAAGLVGPLFADPYPARVLVMSVGPNNATTDLNQSSSGLIPARVDGEYRDVSLNGSGTFMFPDAHRYRDVTVGGSVTATLKPGRYRNITFGGSSKITLMPGSYWLAGSFSVAGSSKVIGTDASLILACGTAANDTRACVNENGGRLIVGGSAQLTLNGNTPTFPAVSFVPGNNADITVSGSAKLVLANSGIDAPNTPIVATGSASITTAGVIHARRVNVTGSSTLTATVIPTPPPTTTTTAAASTTTTSSSTTSSTVPDSTSTTTVPVTTTIPAVTTTVASSTTSSTTTSTSTTTTTTIVLVASTTTTGVTTTTSTTVAGPVDNCGRTTTCGDPLVDRCLEPGAILGTPLPDSLLGSPGDDVICGGDGNDIMDGLGGNDYLSGGRGADTIHGGPGDDSLDGDSDDDSLFGDIGDDTVYGGQGNDTLFGGIDNDSLVGNSGSDQADGGAGSLDLCYSVESTTECETRNDITAVPLPPALLTAAIPEASVSVQTLGGISQDEILISHQNAPDIFAGSLVGGSIDVSLTGRTSVFDHALVTLQVNPNVALTEVAILTREDDRWVEAVEARTENDSTHTITITARHFTPFLAVLRSAVVQPFWDVAVTTNAKRSCLQRGASIDHLVVVDTSGSTAFHEDGNGRARLVGRLSGDSPTNTLKNVWFVSGSRTAKYVWADNVEPALAEAGESFGPSDQILPQLDLGISQLMASPRPVRILTLVIDEIEPGDISAIRASLTRAAGLGITVNVIDTARSGQLTAVGLNPVAGIQVVEPADNSDDAFLFAGTQITARLFDSLSDSDHDGITDCEEVYGIVTVDYQTSAPQLLGLKKTKVFNADSDSDGVIDGAELPLDTSPWARNLEFQLGRFVHVYLSNPESNNTDGDLLPDAIEYVRETNPRRVNRPLEEYEYLTDSDIAALGLKRSKLVTYLKRLGMYKAEFGGATLSGLFGFELAQTMAIRDAAGLEEPDLLQWLIPSVFGVPAETNYFETFEPLSKASKRTMALAEDNKGTVLQLVTTVPGIVLNLGRLDRVQTGAGWVAAIAFSYLGAVAAVGSVFGSATGLVTMAVGSIAVTIPATYAVAGVTLALASCGLLCPVDVQFGLFESLRITAEASALTNLQATNVPRPGIPASKFTGLTRYPGSVLRGVTNGAVDLTGLVSMESAMDRAVIGGLPHARNGSPIVPVLEAGGVKIVAMPARFAGVQLTARQTLAPGVVSPNSLAPLNEAIRPNLILPEAFVPLPGSNPSNYMIGAPGGWPPDSGFLPNSKYLKVLVAGDEFDRVGYPLSGENAGAIGDMYSQRALPPGKGNLISGNPVDVSQYADAGVVVSVEPYTQYRVLKPFGATVGKVAPWFGETGLGTQYTFPVDIQVLLRDGYIRIIYRGPIP